MRILPDRLMLAGLSIFALAEALTHYGQVYPDSPSYFTAAHFFQSHPEPPGTNFRLLRPIVPFLASLVNYFVNIRTSFAIVNLVFWCAAIIVMFYFTNLLTKSLYSSLLASALFTSAIPMLLFGDSALTDMGGYFFILLCVYLSVRWDIPHASMKRVVLMALILAVGVLTRESVASALLFAVVWTVWSGKSISRTLILFLIPLAISIAWSYAVGISYAAWYSQGGLAFAAANQPLSPLYRAERIASTVVYSFGKYPEILALTTLGFLGLRERSDLKIYSSIVIGAFAIILAWPVIDTRFTFILFPFVFPLTGLGFEDAYRIVFQSKLIQSIWPSFVPSDRSRIGFLFMIVFVYALITNIVVRSYVSTPWMPYTDPSVSLSSIV